MLTCESIAPPASFTTITTKSDSCRTMSIYALDVRGSVPIGVNAKVVVYAMIRQAR